MMGNPDQPGLYFLAADEIFRLKRERGYDDMTVWVSFFEIYGGKLYDLLNDRRKLVARADAKQVVNIVGLQETEVTNVGHLMDALNAGHEARSTAATGANMDSSRSHAVLQILFKRRGAKSGTRTRTCTQANAHTHTRTHTLSLSYAPGKLSFIDLMYMYMYTHTHQASSLSLTWPAASAHRMSTTTTGAWWRENQGREDVIEGEGIVECV
jgi:hypothetical protein